MQDHAALTMVTFALGATNGVGIILTGPSESGEPLHKEQVLQRIIPKEMGKVNDYVIIVLLEMICSELHYDKYNC